jgi:hypothetical protein
MDCTQCAAGFVLKSASASDACITDASLYNTSTAKYQPIGTTSDLSVNLKSNLTVSSLIVTGATINGQCKLDTNYNYNYYGNLTASSVLNIKHAGITNTAYFWKVRIRYFVITVDTWWNAQVVTKFLTNSSEASTTDGIWDGNMNENHKVCGNQWVDEHYKIIDQ